MIRMPSPAAPTWHKVFAYLEPIAVQCGQDGWRRSIAWQLFERELALHRDGCRAAVGRAEAECVTLYGVGIVERSVTGFTLGKIR